MRGFIGTQTKARRLWAARSATVTAHNVDNSWLTIAGYGTPFPGFSTSEILNPGVPTFTYGLGVITADVDGWIRVHFMIEIATDATDPEAGRRGIRLLGSSGAVGSNAPSANFQEGIAASPLPMETFYNGPIAAGQTLTTQVFKQSGEDLNIIYRGLTVEFDALA